MKQLLEYDTENIWHVLPNNDLKEHTEKGLICACNPRVEFQQNGGVLVVHNSYDGREFKEKDNIKFKNKN